MTKSRALNTLQSVERILRDVGRLESLSPSQRSQLKSSALREAATIDDIVRFVKRLDQEAQRLRE